MKYRHEIREFLIGNGESFVSDFKILRVLSAKQRHPRFRPNDYIFKVLIEKEVIE